MQLRTHLAISVLAILLLISSVEYKISFVAMTLFATLLPDLDTPFSFLGRYKIFRLFQVFVKHRGFIHSFTFLLFATLLFVALAPKLALGFFVGFGFHIFADSFSYDGIEFFYPFKKKISGWVRTGGKTDTSIFLLFLTLDILVVAILYLGFSF